MKKKFCIELDGKTFRLADHQLIREQETQTVYGCKYLVTDFEKSISRVMHVDSDVKYAEAMVVRTLQDEGEFDEPVSVVTHWKKKHGKNGAQIFFTAVPSRIYLQYTDMIAQHDDYLILVPVFSVMAALIRQVAKNEPAAVVFRHDRFAELVIAKGSKFYYATQCVGFDTSPDQIQSLWETVSREITTACEDSGIRVSEVISLNWIDADEPVPDVFAPGVHFRRFNEEAYVLENTPHTLSFPEALHLFPSTEGIAPNNGKLLHYANKLSPLVMAFFVIASGIHLWGTVFYHEKAMALKERIISYDYRIQALKDEIPPLPDEIEYLPSLRFVDKLFHNQKLPSYTAVINEVSKGISPTGTVDSLDIKYLPKEVQVKITGHIRADFDTAYKAYQYLLSRLETSGYDVDDSRFSTRIDASHFDLSFAWRVK